MWVSPAVFDLACVSVICVCVCLFCMPLFILHSAELIVRCGPHKSVYGNSSQSSHLSSFHASPSSSACVVRRVSVSLCVRFCIKLCCFIMEWLSFTLFVLESVCACSELIQAFLWKVSLKNGRFNQPSQYKMICLTFADVIHWVKQKATAFSSLSFCIIVQRFSNFSGKTKIADNLQHQQLLFYCYEFINQWLVQCMCFWEIITLFLHYITLHYIKTIFNKSMNSPTIWNRSLITVWVPQGCLGRCAVIYFPLKYSKFLILECFSASFQFLPQ